MKAAVFFDIRQQPGIACPGTAAIRPRTTFGTRPGCSLIRIDNQIDIIYWTQSDYLFAAYDNLVIRQDEPIAGELADIPVLAASLLSMAVRIERRLRKNGVSNRSAVPDGSTTVFRSWRRRNGWAGGEAMDAEAIDSRRSAGAAPDWKSPGEGPYNGSVKWQIA
ncbi:MAG: hypothetical protein KatS3mg024_1743 [Armatimonadota bacterium]|nr:MAG: hypothetical protein KatS3mg024_1743 [Armatimonadota bacterium]